MPRIKFSRRLLLLPSALAMTMLAGCNTVLLNPSGDVANQLGELIIASTLWMLVIIVPVIALTLFFAWRYRASNKEATYHPDWSHSTQLELIIWAAPLFIIIVLGLLTWINTHTLDPYRPLGRLDAERPVPTDAEPLTVEVVALDWKWLFIYPEQGIAVVNEMAAPVDRPINFKISASSVMNSFYIPALAGQIYAMPGMETKLHAVINKPGEYEGFSANYSGAGFSDMKFKFHGFDNAQFDAWVAKAKQSDQVLTREAYQKMVEPTIKDPVSYYTVADTQLFKLITERCVEPGSTCMSDTMGHQHKAAAEQALDEIRLASVCVAPQDGQLATDATLAPATARAVKAAVGGDSAADPKTVTTP